MKQRYQKLCSATLTQQLDNRDTPPKVKEIQQIGLDIRLAVLSNNTEMSWSPNPCELCENAVNIPPELNVFAFLPPNWQHRNHTAISSSCLATCQLFWTWHHIRGNLRKTKTPKANTPTLRSKNFANNVELIQMLNRCGHGIVYSQLNCLQKMALTPDNRDL